MSHRTKTLILLVFIVLVSVSILRDVLPGLAHIKRYLPIVDTDITVSAPEQTYSIPPTPTDVPLPSMTPRVLRIPKLGIVASIEHLGVTPTQQMDVPKHADNVGWYKFGPKPSEYGNAVIAGHLDTPSGKPAVFYKLRDLSYGDRVEVESVDGIVSVFEVEGSDVIPYSAFPRDFVFNARAGTNLNLITCGGVWDPVEKVYNSRIVVYTRFVQRL